MGARSGSVLAGPSLGQARGRGGDRGQGGQSHGPGAPRPAQVVQHGHVGEGVVQVVGVGGVVLLHPRLRERALQVEDVVLRLGLIIHTVKAVHLAQDAGVRPEAATGPRQAVPPPHTWPRAAPHMLQEEVQLRVAGGVHGGLEQRQEDVLQHLLKVGQLAFGTVHVTVGERWAHRCVQVRASQCEGSGRPGSVGARPEITEALVSRPGWARRDGPRVEP